MIDPKLLTLQTGKVRPYDWALSSGFTTETIRAVIELDCLIAEKPFRTEAIKEVVWYIIEDFAGEKPRNSSDHRIFCLALEDAGWCSNTSSYEQVQEIGWEVVNGLTDAGEGKEVDKATLKKLRELCFALHNRSEEWQYTVYPDGRRGGQRHMIH